ncbi:MAG: hypothetical protein Ct9H300mP11_17130 [Chloroflexota bacterium]|nr:MAG: hypothetical protein Ct9H300mP11_17130 [Chloroflexota bacterium]
MVQTEPVVFFNGEIKPESLVGISIRDRGFLYGEPSSTPPAHSTEHHSGCLNTSTDSTTRYVISESIRGSSPKRWKTGHVEWWTTTTSCCPWSGYVGNATN